MSEERNPLERLRARAAAEPVPATVVLAEGEDSRVIEAAGRATALGYCKALLVGPGHLNPADDPDLPELTALLADRLAARGGDVSLAPKLALDPLHYAALLVASGKADGAVMGALATTADTLRAALRVIGSRPGLRVVSSCFLMVLPEDRGGRGLIYSDCGVVPDPGPAELADIAEAAAASCRVLLGEEPRVALLSFSTLGSARHRRVDKVRAALALLRERRVDFAVDGELQADAALVPAVASARRRGARWRARPTCSSFRTSTRATFPTS